MKKSIFIVILFSFIHSYAQQKQIDSLLHLLPSLQNDSLKLASYSKICQLCAVKDNLKYGELALNYAEGLQKKGSGISETGVLKYKATYKTVLAFYYQDHQEYDKALEIKQGIIAIYHQIKDTVMLEKTYASICDILLAQRKTNEAFELANTRLTFYEKSKSLNQIAFYQRKLGSLYNRINYYDKMVEYYQKNLATSISINDIGKIAVAHALLATAYSYNKMPEKALDESLKSLDYFQKEKENNKEKIFDALLETASIYAKLNNFKEAILLHERANKIANEFKDSSYVSSVLFARLFICDIQKDYVNALGYAKRWYTISLLDNNEHDVMNAALSLSSNYLSLNQLENAVKYGNIVDSLATKRDDIYVKRTLYDIKYKINQKRGNYQLALENRLKFDELNDSIRKLEDHAGLERKDIISEFEKNQSKQKEEQWLKDQRAEAEKNKQKVITFSIAIGLLIVLIVLLLIYRNYKLKQKSNIELTERNAEISKQKHIVEEKQKEITESITYAKRLQEAILPPLDFVNTHWADNFVYYKPKDIVAGDFYWAEKVGDKFYIAAADSTGHGVPGAMVSVVCSNALNRTIKEFKLQETGSILDKTRDLVLETFEKSASEVKDGMDISLLCIDVSANTISWSGANNPLWYIQNNELKEIKGDKQPIGKSDYPKPFTTHEIEYLKGTTFYLFTDGFADQFGGTNGKKFKYKQFSELLLLQANLPLKQQAAIIHKALLEWKGHLEQVDDICVIGISV